MNEKTQIRATWPVILLAISFAMSALIAANAYRYHALHSNDLMNPTITVSGEGEAVALPDIATITFSISNLSPQVKDAQKNVEATMKKVNDGLTALSISAKDIKTENYTISPRYSYVQVVCNSNGSCPSSTKLDGYEVRESVTVKLRKTDLAGDVLALLGKNEVTDVQGPNFAVENEDELIKNARAEAIEKAKTKAKETASSLGVDLGEMQSYTEGGVTPYPMMERKAYSMALDAAAPAPAVSVSQGESKVKVTVNLTYSLR